MSWLGDVQEKAGNYDAKGLLDMGFFSVDFQRNGYTMLSSYNSDLDINQSELRESGFSFDGLSSDNEMIACTYKNCRLSVTVWVNVAELPKCPECGSNWNYEHNRCESNCQTLVVA